MTPFAYELSGGMKRLSVRRQAENRCGRSSRRVYMYEQGRVVITEAQQESQRNVEGVKAL